jgi:hypothetical protein
MPPEIDNKKLEKLQKLLEIANEDFATPDDLIKLSEAIIAIITSEKNRLDTLIADTKGKTDTEISRTLSELAKKEKTLVTFIENLRQQTSTDLTKATASLSKEIKRVEGKIPTRTDLTGIYSEIEAIKRDLVTVPTEITANPEAVRNALELLQGDERLDKSAIKGLDELINDLRKIAGTSQPQAVGVRLLRYLSDVNIEGIIDGQTLVWDTVTQRFIPGIGGTGGGHTIEDEGTPLTQRTNLNFVGANVTVTDDAGNDATVVTISGGGSGTVNTIVAGNNIDVDATDPANPIVSVETLTLADISDVTASVIEINYVDGVTSAIQTQINGKAPSLGADDNYVTDAEKAALHAAVTVTDSTSIDITLTGQDITAQREALTGAITAPKNSNTTSLGSFTTAQLNTALSDADVATGGGTATGTNTGDQTTIVGITGTKAQFDTAVTDGNFMYIGDAPTAHTHLLANVTDVTITAANLNSLDDGVDSTLHFHATDRARANHTGTQLASTISDFASTVLATALTGLSLVTGTAVTAADSILVAIGKLQKQNTDQDTAIALNTAKVTNATHTGEVTGSGALTVDKTAITNKSTVTPVAGDFILFSDTSDSGNLKKANFSDFGGGGGSSTSVFTNQTPDNGTYALLSGTVNGSNTVFTVNGGVYVTGTLTVYLNGQLLTQGATNDWQETAPASGTFTVITAPQTGDIITVQFQATAAVPNGLVTTEIEVDFGTVSTTSKRFTITDAGITGTSKIMAVSSGNPATGRGIDDHEWDSITYACQSGTGQFTLSAKASGKIIGKRKVYYSVA